jgi:hypothetical protein
MIGSSTEARPNWLRGCNRGDAHALACVLELPSMVLTLVIKVRGEAKTEREREKEREREVPFQLAIHNDSTR